jgi:hypothetical protein
VSGNSSSPARAASASSLLKFLAGGYFAAKSVDAAFPFIYPAACQNANFYTKFVIAFVFSYILFCPVRAVRFIERQGKRKRFFRRLQWVFLTQYCEKRMKLCLFDPLKENVLFFIETSS